MTPESVWVPLPVLTRDRAPVPFWITPAKLVEELAPPVVNVAAVELLLVTVPPVPANEPMLLLKPARSRVVPLDRVTAEFVPKAEVAPACSVPALTVVEPV